MAKATITFTDNDDGTINIKLTFDPELDLTTDTASAAQLMAFSAMNYTIGAGDVMDDDDMLVDDAS